MRARPGLPADALRVRLSAPAGKPTSRCETRQPVTLIGGRRDCHLSISHGEVSQLHCAIIHTGSELLVCDLHSRTGTFLNDQRVGVARLRPGDALRVGPIGVAIEFPGQPATTPEPLEGRCVGQPLPQTLRIEGPERTFELTCLPAVIGRRANCEVLVDTPDTSLVHALIVSIDGRPALFDLGSRSGTLLNGQPVDFVWLQDGDRLGVGGVELGVSWTGPQGDQPVAPPTTTDATDVASKTDELPLATGPLELGDLERMLAVLHQQIAGSRAKLLERTAELDAREQALARTQSELEQQRQELERCRQELERLQAELTTRAQELEHTRQELERQSSQTAEERARLEQQQQQLQQRGEQLEKLRLESEAAAADAQNRTRALQEQTDRLAEREAALRGQEQALAEAREALERERTELQQSEARLREQLEARQKELEQRIAEHQALLDGLQQREQSLAERAAQLDRRQAELDERARVLQAAEAALAAREAAEAEAARKIQLFQAALQDAARLFNQIDPDSLLAARTTLSPAASETVSQPSAPEGPQPPASAAPSAPAPAAAGQTAKAAGAARGWRIAPRKSAADAAPPAQAEAEAIPADWSPEMKERFRVLRRVSRKTDEELRAQVLAEFSVRQPNGKGPPVQPPAKKRGWW